MFYGPGKYFLTYAIIFPILNTWEPRVWLYRVTVIPTLTEFLFYQCNWVNTSVSSVSILVKWIILTSSAWTEIWLHSLHVFISNRTLSFHYMNGKRTIIIILPKIIVRSACFFPFAIRLLFTFAFVKPCTLDNERLEHSLWWIQHVPLWYV